MQAARGMVGNRTLRLASVPAQAGSRMLGVDATARPAFRLLHSAAVEGAEVSGRGRRDLRSCHAMEAVGEGCRARRLSAVVEVQAGLDRSFCNCQGREKGRCSVVTAL